MCWLRPRRVRCPKQQPLPPITPYSPPRTHRRPGHRVRFDAIGAGAATRVGDRGPCGGLPVRTLVDSPTC